jgi:hypothetical protein
MSRENISSAGTEQAVDGNFSGDSRASPRRRRLNGAKIVFNNNASVIDCVVRDISPQGELPPNLGDGRVRRQRFELAI